MVKVSCKVILGSIAKTWYILILYICIGVDMTDNGPEYNQKKSQAQALPDFHIWQFYFFNFLLINEWHAPATDVPIFMILLSNYRFSRALNQLMRYLKQFQDKFTWSMSNAKSVWAQKQYKLYIFTFFGLGTF